MQVPGVVWCLNDHARKEMFASPGGWRPLSSSRSPTTMRIAIDALLALRRAAVATDLRVSPE
jgi:hypothetical protein